MEFFGCSLSDETKACRQWEHVPTSDDEILAMHDVDLQLYNDIAAMRPGDVDRNGALNPYGYEPERYFSHVAKYRGTFQQNPDFPIEEAYRELTSQLSLDFDLEAAIERIRFDAAHVRLPELLRRLIMEKHDYCNKRYDEEQRKMSRRNAEAYRHGRYAGAAAFHDAMQQ